MRSLPAPLGCRPVRAFVRLGFYGRVDHLLALCLLADGRDDPQIIQGGWPQAVYEPPHFGEGLLRSLLEARERLFGVLRPGPDQLARRMELQGKACQRGPNAIVQVAPQAPPLLLTRCDQSFAGVLEVGGERDGVHGYLGLTGQVLQKLPVDI